MNITKTRLEEIIKEELHTVLLKEAHGTQEPIPSYSSYQSTAPELSDDDIVQYISTASKLLEDLPLNDLPESVTQAAGNLRDAMVEMEIGAVEIPSVLHPDS